MESRNDWNKPELIGKYKSELPVLFKSIGLHAVPYNYFEWLECPVFYGDQQLFTLKALPKTIDVSTGNVVIDYKFESPLVSGLTLLNDQACELHDQLEKRNIVHLLGTTSESDKNYEGMGIVIPFVYKPNKISRVINLYFDNQKNRSDKSPLNWEIVKREHLHTNAFALKALGLNPKIVIS